MMKPYFVLVDDEQMVLEGLKTEMRLAFGDKFNYEIAESGEEALELLDELEINGASVALVISDWLMPGMRGDIFLKHVNERYPEIPKVMISGHADPEALERTKKAMTRSKFLPKPWDQEVLLRTIREMVAAAA
jgi:DNA-binding NtrC family response regulator